MYKVCLTNFRVSSTNLILKSEEISDVVQGTNSVSFVYDGTTWALERLLNSIHIGSKGDIEKLVSQIDSMEYLPLFEAETLKSGHPKEFDQLILNVTEVCNLMCGYCIYSGDYSGERVASAKSMTLDVALRAVDTFLEICSEDPVISFYGGEPTKNFQLISQIMEYAQQKRPDISFSMTTNFVDVEAIFGDLLRYGVLTTVSLDGPKHIHDKYRITRGREPTFDRIWGNIQSIRAIDEEYVAQKMSLNGTFFNNEDFSEIVDFFIEINDSFCSLSVGAVERKGLPFEIRQQHETTYPILDDYLRFGLLHVGKMAEGEISQNVLQRLFDLNLKNIYERSRDRVPETLMLQGACYPGKRRLFVDTNGVFYSCEKMGRREPLGDVYTGYADQYATELIDTFRDIRDETCVGCWNSRLCTPCYVTSKDEEGISSSGLLQTCDSLKANTILSVILYTKLVQLDVDNRREVYFENI